MCVVCGEFIAEIRVMQDPETDGEGEVEDEEAVTDRPDPTLEDTSEALAVLNRIFIKCCIYENV